MKRLIILAASAVSVAVTALASVTSIGKLTLSGDETLDVTEETHLYLLDATTDCTLTVTGGGDLHISRILSPKVNIRLVSGHVFVGGELLTPTALTTAQFRLDASNADSLETETVEAEGRTYVNTWSDANGGSTAATAGTVRPYLTTESGRTWVDFGSLKGETLEGYGGYMTVPAVKGIREAYVVARPDDSVRPAAVRTTVLTDSSQWTVFLSGANDANYWPEFVWRWNQYNKPSGYLMNGVYQDGVVMGKGGTWSQGVHVYDLQIEDGASDNDCKFSSLCNCAEGKSTGGFRVGEIATFTVHLEESDRDLINNYMTAKWMADYVKPTEDRFELGKDTYVKVWNGTGWDTYKFKEPDVQVGTLNLTEDVTINVNEEVTYEIYGLTADGAHTLTKTGPGILKICALESSDITFAVEGGEIVFDDPGLPKTMLKDAVLWLDAEAADTLTALGGQVSGWTSVNGAEVSAVAGTTAPVLSTENGRTMVDFGPADATAPAYMTLSSTITGVREAFAVAKGDPTINTAGKRVSLFGTSGYTAFQAGFFQQTYCELFNRYQIPTTSDHYTYQLDGGLSFDGDPIGNVAAWQTRLVSYGFRLTEPDAGGTDWATISSLCNSFGRGGFKVGEVLVFKSQLSEANRALVNAYLKAKWLSARHYRVRKFDSVSGGSVKVLNGGTLEVVELPAASKLDWSSGNGTVVFNPLNRQAMLHLDAEDGETMVKSESEDKTLVTRWNDTDGGLVYASTTGTAPYLTTDGDRTYMDFGTGKNDSVAGYGASLDMSQVLSGIRDVFFVARPDESLITGRLRAGVIDHRTEWKAFQPGFSQSATAYCEMINMYQNYTKQLGEGVFVDGVKSSGRAFWSSGYHLYNFRPCAPEDVGLASDNAMVNSICRTGSSLSNACGGFRVGELLIFDRTLGEDEHELVYRQLRAKWFGDEGNACSFGEITVPADGAFKVPYAVASVGTLKIGGTLEAQSVAAQAIVPLSSDAAISGMLDLTTPGTIRVDSSVFGQQEGAFRILSAAGAKGRASAWTLEGDLAKGRKAKMMADGLYAVPVMGLSIILR